MGVSAVANNTSAANNTWEIYAQMEAFSNGQFIASVSSGATWAWTMAQGQTDPGGASDEVVIGTGGPLLYGTGTGLDAVRDGTTYARFQVSYFDSLTTRRVSTLNGAMNPQGSIPPFNATGQLTYTSTDTTITWSWTVMTVYRTDGTTTSVSSGSLEISGLTASTTYYFYPYLDEVNESIEFATSYSGSVGTPAAAYTATNPQAAAEGIYYANAPLGVLTASTAASGGSGGGGGNFVCCLNGNQPVELASGEEKFADRLAVGDFLTSPRGPVRVRQVKHEPWEKWMQVTFSNGVEVLVVHDHRFIDPSGYEVRASDLRIEQIIDGRARPVYVCGLRQVIATGVKVSIEVDAPRVYYVQGILSHNKETC